MNLRNLSHRLFATVITSVILFGTARAAAADTITLMWDANSDLQVAGYFVHVGTQPGTYTQRLDAGLTTQYGFDGAVPGQQYCFAVSAYYTGPLEGAKSTETCGYSNRVPTLVNPGARSSITGQATTLQLQGSDPEGRSIWYHAAGLPLGLTLQNATGLVSGTPTTAGSFNVTITISDGTLTASQSFTWTITSPDAVAPVVTITSPTSAATFLATSSPITLSGTASDAVGVTQVTWSNDRGGSGTASGTTNWSAANITLQAGSNVLTVTARDAVGNTSNDVVTVTLNVAPTLAAVANQSTVVGQSASLQLAGSDANGTPVTYSATGLPAGLSVNVTSGLVSGTATTAGTSNVTVTVSDGSLTASRSFTWTVNSVADTTAPSVAMSAPASGSTVSGTVAVSATAADASGVAGVQFKLDGVNLGAEDLASPYSVSWDTTTASAGSHTLTAVARDAAGNTATSVALSVVVNNVVTPPPPVGDGDIVSSLVGHWRFDEGTGATTLDSAGAFPGALRGGALWANGRLGKALQFDGVDDFVEVGNLDVAGSALTMAAWIRPDGFLVDDGRIISKSTGMMEQDHVFMLSTVDGGGDYKLRFRLKAGGVTSTLIASSGSLPTGEWVHAAAVYNGSAMILYLNGAEVGRLAKSGALSTDSTIPVAIARNPQAYGAFMGAVDDVRIYSRALSVGDLQMLVAGDTTAPAVAIVGPTSAATHQTGASTVTLTGTASDAVGVTSVSWSNDRGGSGTASGTSVWTTPAIALQKGLNVVTVTALDAAGNSATDVITVMRNTAPVLAAVSSQASEVGRAASLQLAGSDADGDVLTYGANGLPPGMALTVSTGAISGTPTDAGTYAVTATVFDGVQSATGTFTWTVAGDQTVPSVSITAPTSASTFTATAATMALSGTAADNKGVTSVSWSNDRGGAGTATGTTSWSVASVALQSGANVITVTARDAAGNTASDVITVTYSAGDTTAPTVKITAPAASFTTTASTMTLGGTASDNVGVTLVSWVNSLGGSGNATGTASWSVSVALKAGNNVFTVTARDAKGNLGKAIVSVYRSVAPTLSAVSSRTTRIGQAVSLQLVGADANNDALTYSAVNLPTGLSLNASTGLITGSPTKVGSYAVTVSVSDGSLSASRSFTWTTKR